MKDSIVSFCVGIGLSIACSGSFVAPAEASDVGYADLSFHAGYALVANPFSNQANRVVQIFSLPLVEGTQLVKFDGNRRLTNEVVGGSWTIPEMTLSPGEAALLRNPSDFVTYTFVGSILKARGASSSKPGDQQPTNHDDESNE